MRYLICFWIGGFFGFILAAILSSSKDNKNTDE